jgi:hypothetical protein
MPEVSDSPEALRFMVAALTKIAATQNTRHIGPDGPSLSLDAEKRMREIALDALAGKPIAADLYEQAIARLEEDTRDVKLFDGGRTSDAWNERSERLSAIMHAQRTGAALPDGAVSR